MRNKLFTASVDKMLFKQYPLGSDLEKQKVVAKIFNPYGDARWYLLNSDPEDPDYIWAIVSMFGNVEIGSVSRSELLGARIRPFGLPLERDLYFTPQNAAEVYRGLLDGKFYEDGGEVKEMKQLWFVTDSRGSVKNISTSVQAAEVFLASALKYDGVINYVKVPLKDWESEKVNVGNIRGYASSFWKSYKKGGVTDDLEKELRKLQRDLNSPRLSSYMEGDNSAEEMARQAERAAKLARFDEVLRLLRESDAKFANGGYFDDGDNNYVGGGGGFDQYGNPYGYERDYDSVYEIHHKPDMNPKMPYMIWDKLDGVYVGAYASRHRAIEWIERQPYYAKGGEMKNESKETDFYAITKWHTGEVKLVPIKNVSFWQGRQNDHEPTKENLELFFKQIPWDESVCIYDNDTASDGTLHSAHTPLFTAGAKYVHGIVDKNQNPVHFSYKGFFAKGGVTGYERLVKKVAANYEGKAVPSKYQSKYGKRYDADEAKKVGYAVATKVYGKPMARMAEGGEIKKTYRHKHIPTMTLEIIDYTNTGVRGLQKDSKSLSRKERTEGKVVFYSKTDLKELWDEQFSYGGETDSEITAEDRMIAQQHNYKLDL